MAELVEKIFSVASISEDARLIASTPAPVRENELLLFFKPEVFLAGANSTQLVEVGLQMLDRFGIEISACMVVPGAELERLSIMDTHYGYINKISRRASLELDKTQMAAIRNAVGASEETPVLGGHEVLQNYPNETAESLDRLWATKKSIKLRSGLYIQQYEFEGTPTVVVNGFHPEQLAHFTKADRKIVLLRIHSDLPWKFLRTCVLGDTFPEKALPDTMRRHYYDKAREYGLPNVSIANNCVHLSAGPFEAAFELQNFLGRAAGLEFDLNKTNVGKRLEANRPDIQGALANPTTTVNSRSISLFDLTEEFDTTGAVDVFRRLFRDSD